MNTPFKVNYWNNFIDSTWLNSENGEYDYFPYSGSANALGKYNETVTAGIFRDIYDNQNDDYSGYSDWGYTTIPHTPDGVADTLNNGINNILTVLVDREVNGHHPDNIDEFWEAWFECGNSLGHGNAMEDIWYEHSEIMSCCQFRGDVAIPKDGSILVNDIVWIVDYIFKGGYLVCESEADVNNDGFIDVSDPTYFVEFLFKGGPAIVTCP